MSEITMRRHAELIAKTSRNGRPSEDGGDARYVILARRKQSAVAWDICPTGPAPGNIGKPRSSASGYAPLYDSANREIATAAPAMFAVAPSK